MNYVETFIRVAPDCPVKVAVVPVSRGERKSVAVIEYELLSGRPYSYTQEELQFAVHVQREAIPERELKAHREVLWAEFFATSHACLRASPLPKKYGWGIHFNAEGKAAIYPVESKEYQMLSQATGDNTVSHML